MFDNRETIEGYPQGARPSYVDTDWSTVDLSPGARVTRGTLYIERNYPDRLALIDWVTLDIDSNECCVLGKLHGNYLNSPEFVYGEAFCRAHGFVAFDAVGEHGYETDLCDLNSLWRKAIRDARART